MALPSQVVGSAGVVAVEVDQPRVHPRAKSCSTIASLGEIVKWPIIHIGLHNGRYPVSKTIGPSGWVMRSTPMGSGSDHSPSVKDRRRRTATHRSI